MGAGSSARTNSQDHLSEEAQHASAGSMKEMLKLSYESRASGASLLASDLKHENIAEITCGGAVALDLDDLNTITKGSRVDIWSPDGVSWRVLANPWLRTKQPDFRSE